MSRFSNPRQSEYLQRNERAHELFPDLTLIKPVLLVIGESLYVCQLEAVNFGLEIRQSVFLLQAFQLALIDTDLVGRCFRRPFL
jgi:hypothetical protein